MAKTPFSTSSFLYVFIGWWLLWSAMQIWVIQRLGFSWYVAMNDSLITNSLLACVCVAISNNLQYYLPKRERYWYVVLLSVVLSVLWWLASRQVVPALTDDEDGYYKFFSASFPVRVCIAFLMTACMSMICMLYYSFEEQKSSARRKAEAEQLTKDAELFKLRQQLQPHFLFNSLNSINALIGTRPGEARTMVQQLSEFLRGTLRREEHQWISLQEELQYLQLYLAIEQVRFGNRLSTAFQVSEESKLARIPAMLLQPLVENAIKFGLYDTVGATLIRVETAIQNGVLVIDVENPFDPETAQTQHGTGFGLASIRRRLFLLFARNDLVSTQSMDHQFKTTVKIPQ